MLGAPRCGVCRSGPVLTNGMGRSEGFGKDLERIWEGSGKDLGRIWEGFGKELGRIREGFGKGLGRIWEGFGKDLGRIWEGDLQIHTEFSREVSASDLSVRERRECFTKG